MLALALLVLAGVAQAGVIQGITLENFTGFPLARARVRLFRLEGDKLVPMATAIATRGGQFIFPSLPEGYYQLSGVRAGFAEARHGQRKNNAPGTPIFVTADGIQYIELRLKRLGMITGRTLDENRVGLGGIPVIAYTTTVPMKIVASSTSDERGVYRITGLMPGKYFVRTGPAQVEEQYSVVPTYHPFTTVQLRDARPVAADLDLDTTEIDIQPAPGQLVSLTVKVSGCLGIAKVTLSTDTGRKESSCVCNEGAAGFEGLTPGEYEVLAEGELEGRKLAAYTWTHVDGRREIGLPVRPLMELRVKTVDGTPAVKDAGIVVRRRDMAGEGAEVTITSERTQLAPGFWQMTAHPPAGFYLRDVGVGRPSRLVREPNPDWWEFPLEYPMEASVNIPQRQAQVMGRVTLGNKGAMAAPVYLMATEPRTRRQVNGLRTTRTDADGNFRFDRLAPGTYLLLSTFDLAEMSEDAMVAAQAVTVKLEEGQNRSQSLELRDQP